MKNRYVLGLAAASVAAFLAGCSPEARQDLGEAGDKVGSATEKSAKATAETAAKAGQEVKAGAQNAGTAIESGAQKAADATKSGAKMAGEAIGGAGDKMELTPKIKAALVADKGIDASNLNVDTMTDTKTIVIKGTVGSADKKNRVTQVAQKALADTSEGKEGYKIKNEVTVGPPGPKM